MGTVKLGRNIGVKYPKKFVIPNDKEAIDLIYKAKDLGINLIDTAPSYGKGEAFLQEWNDKNKNCVYYKQKQNIFALQKENTEPFYYTTINYFITAVIRLK